MATPITNGAELVLALRELGTGEAKLAVARAELERIHREDRRTADAGEVIAALDAALPPDHLTLVKVRQLAETGEYVGPVTEATVSIEDRLAGRTKPAAAPSPTLVVDPKAILDRLAAVERQLAEKAAENRKLGAEAESHAARAAAAEAALAEAKAAASTTPAGEAEKSAGEPTTASPPPPPASPKPPAGGRR